MIDHYGTRIRLKFNKSCLKQPNIVYELGASGSNDNDPTLKNCFFGAVILTNADIEKCGHSGFGIGFDGRFSFAGGGFGQNVLIFGVDMSSSAHIDNKKKDILVLRKGPTQGLEKCIPLSLLLQIKNFV